MENRFGQLAKERKVAQDIIKNEINIASADKSEAQNLPKVEEPPVKDTSKKMDVNTASIMFYLPEDMKFDLMIYAKKRKETVSDFLRQLISNEIYK